MVSSAKETGHVTTVSEAVLRLDAIFAPPIATQMTSAAENRFRFVVTDSLGPQNTTSGFGWAPYLTSVAAAEEPVSVSDYYEYADAVNAGFNSSGPDAHLDSVHFTLAQTIFLGLLAGTVSLVTITGT